MSKNLFFRNVEEIKKNGKAFLKGMGYKNIVFEGADPSIIFGGYVWFQATHKTDSKLLYTILVRKQGNSFKVVGERIMNPEVKTFIQSR